MSAKDYVRLTLGTKSDFGEEDRFCTIPFSIFKGEGERPWAELWL
jgi:hypothetical protein